MCKPVKGGAEVFQSWVLEAVAEMQKRTKASVNGMNTRWMKWHWRDCDLPILKEQVSLCDAEYEGRSERDALSFAALAHS